MPLRQSVCLLGAPLLGFTDVSFMVSLLFFWQLPRGFVQFVTEEIVGRPARDVIRSEVKQDITDILKPSAVF